jgi:hypothetical protein
MCTPGGMRKAIMRYVNLNIFIVMTPTTSGRYKVGEKLLYIGGYENKKQKIEYS